MHNRSEPWLCLTVEPLMLIFLVFTLLLDWMSGCVISMVLVHLSVFQVYNACVTGLMSVKSTHFLWEGLCINQRKPKSTPMTQNNFCLGNLSENDRQAQTNCLTSVSLTTKCLHGTLTPYIRCISLLLVLNGEHLHTKILHCNEVGINFCTADLWAGIICVPTTSVPAECNYCSTLEGFVSLNSHEEAEHYGKLRTKYTGLVVSNITVIK